MSEKLSQDNLAFQVWDIGAFVQGEQVGNLRILGCCCSSCPRSEGAVLYQH